MPRLKKKKKITRETEATKQDATRVFRAACIIDGAYIRKVCKLALCKFSDLDRGQVLQMSCIMLGDAICRVEKCFCSIETFFFSCVFSLFSSVPPAFSAIPSPSSLSLLSLSLISDPFFMHYSITLNSHLQCITSSHLSQTHFILPSPSFSHFASLPPSLALLQCVITLSSTSLLRPLFIISLSFLRSRHLMLISRVSFPPLSLLPI